MALSAQLFGKLLFVLSVLCGTPWGRFQVLLFLDHGITPSQYGTVQLFGIPFKACGYVAWGMAADTVGLKTALLGSIVASTLILEVFRHSFVFTSLWLVILVKIIRTAANGAWPLCDSYAVKAAGTEAYGGIRVWGSASYGFSGLFVGWVLDALYSRFGYDSIFGLTYALAGLLVVLIVRYFPNNLDAKQYRKATPSLSGIVSSLMNRNVFNFLVVNFCFGIAVSVSTMVVPAWAKTAHGAKAGQLGLITFMACIFGLIVFNYAGTLIQRHGAKKLILVAHAGHAVRMCLYSLVTSENSYYLLPAIESLHCFSFALFWNCSTSILHSLAPPDALATAQTMLSSTHMTLAQMSGGFLFLHLMELYSFDLVWKVGLVVTVFSAAMTSWLVTIPKTIIEIEEGNVGERVVSKST